MCGSRQSCFFVFVLSKVCSFYLQGGLGPVEVYWVIWLRLFLTHRYLVHLPHSWEAPEQMTRDRKKQL